MKKMTCIHNAHVELPVFVSIAYFKEHSAPMQLLQPPTEGFPHFSHPSVPLPLLSLLCPSFLALPRKEAREWTAVKPIFAVAKRCRAAEGTSAARGGGSAERLYGY